MGIRFACHACDQKLNIKSELAGRRGICPSCSTRFRIPLQDAEKSSPVEDNSPAKPAAVGRETQAEVNVAKPTDAPGPTGGVDQQAVIAPPQRTSPATILDEESEGIWYVRPPSGGQYGPATTDLLKQWIDEGRVAATALLWREGWPQWRGASEALPELVEMLPDNATVPAAVDSQRNVAGGATPAVTTAGASISGVLETNSSRQAVVEPTNSGASKLVGEAAVGTNRRKRSNRRLYVIGALTAVAVTLIVALIFVSNR